MFSRFFIERPVFSWVIAIVIMLAGLLSISTLPVSQFPQIAPPQVKISARYPGASAETVSNTVTQVLEQNLSGLDGFMYMSSTSDSSGTASITLTFEAGTNPDIAQVQVQNKIQTAITTLPTVVQNLGVSVKKTSASFLMVVGLINEDGRYSAADLGDYLSSYVKDPLARVDGVGEIQVFGAKYAMRVWLDPKKLAQYNLMPSDVTNAISAQNIQLSTGGVAQQPTDGRQQFTATIMSSSMLQTPEQFRNILLKVKQDGSTVNLSDVARIQVGQQDYMAPGTFNGKPSAAMAISLASGANAIATADAVRAKMDQLKENFPEGVQITYPFETTPFVMAALEEVVKTLIEAIVLVVFVMFLFLQNFRATLIPTIAVPVVLLGTFGALAVAGFSINMLTMFAMVLAIGLLVDDAIVVVENVERVMREDGTDPKTATIKSMGEIQSALIGIAMVLSAVFVPMAFFGGSAGVIYRQFSITIVSAMVLSVLVALTLTPSLCATLLKPIDKEHHEAKTGFFGWFNRMFEGFTNMVKAAVSKLTHGIAMVLVVYAGIVALVAVGFVKLPSSFMPSEDQGVLMMMMQLPDGATMERTDIELKKVQGLLHATESKNIDGFFSVRGFSFAGTGQNMALGFIKLKDWSERKSPEQRDLAIQGRVMGALLFGPDFRGASTVVFPLPAAPELGVADGFDFYIQDNTGGSHEKFMQYMGQFLAKANADPRLTMVRHNGMGDTTQLKLVIDHKKLSMMKVNVADVNTTIATAMSGKYVNDYMDRGVIKQVWVQGDINSRMQPEDVLKWEVRNSDGDMVKISTFAHFEWNYGSPRLERFNGIPSLNIQGSPAAGVSSGDAMDAVEELIHQVFPPGFEIAWNGVSYQERAAGAQGPALYAISLLVVFLCLAALYESWSIPVAVLLIVPCGVVGAFGLTWLLGMTNDIYFQVGLLTTIGLVSKNAILIVEFAKEYMERGIDAIHATEEAVRVRLRPIIMTSLAFGLGVLPLAIAHGAGAGAQNAIGVGVLGGILAGTFLVIAFVPVFYVMIGRVFGRPKSRAND